MKRELTEHSDQQESIKEEINMSEKIYLGLSLGFNSSAALVSDTRGVLAAVSQERLNGIKNTKELPIDAALECLSIAGVNDIEGIAISHYEDIRQAYFERYTSDEYKDYFTATNWPHALINILTDHGIKLRINKVTRIPHHIAHAYSAYAFHGRPKDGDYTITSDGFGDGLSGMISRDGKVVSFVQLKNSIALVYQFVTGALGFKEHQHEGKITGLAAYGNPIYLGDFEALYNNSYCGNFLNFKDDEYEIDQDTSDSAIVDFDKFLKLKKAVYSLVNRLTGEGAKREDIAATVQEFSEIHTLNWIRANCEPGNNCYLAGGLHANVKINQRIKDSGIFKNVFVSPAMGDEGTSVGAALYAVSDPNTKCPNNIPINTLQTTCAGNFADDEFKFNDDKYNVVEFDNDDEVIDAISKRLANNKIVCLVRGRMEFGPRALCHRSILYNCDTKETNDWLNKKLSRTEFMPFAPVCCEEFADDLFKNLDGGRSSAKLMTMTFDCKEEFIKNYPAACHIDNTARPQIVSYEDDPFTWKVLKNYHSLTGKKALINTSFNLHNWPIIATKKVAVESWITSDTDCLVIGNMLIEKKECE